jgi:hypothetical protein
MSGLLLFCIFDLLLACDLILLRRLFYYLAIFKLAAGYLRILNVLDHRLKEGCASALELLVRLPHGYELGSLVDHVTIADINVGDTLCAKSLKVLCVRRIRLEFVVRVWR